MNDVSILLTLAGVLLLSVVSPGPNFVIVTSTASVSRRAGIATGLGLAAASGTWALIAISGLGLILSHALWIASVLRLAGATYLIWLGIKTVLTARRPLLAQDKASQSDWAAAKQGYLVSMTNPKAIAFYGSVFALLVPAHVPVWFGAAVVGLAIGISCCWYCAMALLASHPAVRRTLIRRKAALDTTAGLVLIALGSRMLATR
jgi:threonine efflux protein